MNNTFILLTLLSVSPALAAFSYSRSLTIDHTKCATSDSYNFPVLVALSDVTLRTAANGGHIHNTVTQSGGSAVTGPADITFTSDPAGTAQLPWEVESYDALNGALVAWLQVPHLSHTTDTVVYVFGSEREFGETANWPRLERFALPGISGCRIGPSGDETGRQTAKPRLL